MCIAIAASDARYRLVFLALNGMALLRITR
jgi:hypothetical protein